MKSLLLAPILFTTSALTEPSPIPAPDNATTPYVILIKPGRYRWQQTF